MAKKATAEPADKKINIDPTAIVECAAEYESLMGQRQRLDQKIGTMFDNYAKKGVTKARIKADYKRRNMTAEEVQAEVEEDLLYARVLGRIEWNKKGQAGFSAALDETVPTPSIEAQAALARSRAYTDGYNSGRFGGSIDGNKHKPGTEPYSSWRTGWQDGHGDRLDANPEADKVTQAAPRRRGVAAAQTEAAP